MKKLLDTLRLFFAILSLVTYVVYVQIRDYRANFSRVNFSAVKAKRRLSIFQMPRTVCHEQ